MDRFLQLHLLTSYGPANLNRDDLGRPKTALVGGVNRLRISSQSLKRAWRTSSVFEDVLGENRGIRTKEIGVGVRDRMLAAGASDKLAEACAEAIAKQFGKLKKKLDAKEKASLKSGELAIEKARALAARPFQIEQLAHISPTEKALIHTLADTLAAEGREPEKDELELLRKKHKASDIALFGRMFADKPGFNMEAACQVAHAITVHKAQVEDDFFTAVDDLNTGEDDAGAGHMGETEFSAGVFYTYICIDRQQLLNNLDGDRALCDATLQALTECAATIAPTGKQNSFASRARASFVLAETGAQQPRSLVSSFMQPVNGQNQERTAIAQLLARRDSMDQAYGVCSTAQYTLNATAELDGPQGTLVELKDFVAN